MRYLAIILTIYSLLLTVVPCTDVHDIRQGASDMELVQSSDQMNDSHLDICSPFCSCACQSLAEAGSVEFNFTTQPQNTKLVTLTPNVLETDQPDWFQPPIV